MDTLGAGSRKTVDIVGPIDSIAGQASILALNAAVEAARAGEHGRRERGTHESGSRLLEDAGKATTEIMTKGRKSANC